MYLKIKILNKLSNLRAYSQSWDESADQLSTSGLVTEASIRQLIDIFSVFLSEGIPTPNLLVADSNEDENSLESILEGIETHNGLPWQLTLSKSRLLLNPNDKLFISKDAFITWADKLRPTETFGINFNQPITFLIGGLGEAFGGPFIKFLPADIDSFHIDQPPTNFPSESDIRSNVRVTTGIQICLSLNGLALTWGNLNQAEAMPFKRLFMAVMCVPLAQEVYVLDKDIKVILRGTKSLESNLTDNWSFDVTADDLKKVTSAVLWMFQERIETRQKLISDRLSLDITDPTSFIRGVLTSIEHALIQAKEKYGFVILERKDSYLKELKEVMKDVRVQADLYAGKVRELINTLLRDVLAALFLVGVSLITKLNTTALDKMSDENQLFIFLKVLAVYFIISISLQLGSHWKDLLLAKNECEKWLQLTHDYLTEETVDKNFTKPLEKRRNTFMFFSGLILLIYLIIAIASWKAEYIYQYIKIDKESDVKTHATTKSLKPLNLAFVTCLAKKSSN